jgi:hypothetical protein
MRYLYLLINENKRPLSWIGRARTKLRELADWIYSNQVGFGTSTSSTKSNDFLFGRVTLSGIDAGSNTTTFNQAELGMGMLLAYRLFGDSRYIASARGFANILTNCQQVVLKTAGYPTGSGTGRINALAWPDTANGSSAVAANYSPLGFLCLEFLNELKATDGDQLAGADTTITGIFTVAPQQLLSTSITAARTFWANGYFDATLGTVIKGFTSATPKDKFASIVNGLGGSGSWEYASGGTAGIAITGSNWAFGLRSLYAYEGYSATVADVFTYLMGFTSNSALQANSTSLGQDYPTETSGRGDYDPVNGLAGTLNVRDVSLAPTAVNATTGLDVRTVGLLAAIQNARNSGALKASKDSAMTFGAAYVDEYSAGVSTRQTELPATSFFNTALTLTYFLNGRFVVSSSLANAAQDSWQPSTAACVGQALRQNPTFQLQV